MSVKLAQNGYSYAPLETMREQRTKRLKAEISVRKSLSIEDIRKICGYKSVNGAREFAEVLAFENPKIFNLVPSKKDKKHKTEAQRLILLI